MDELPLTRRTLRACEPCRRKKVKCPGEHPVCSYCRRLKQRCNYRTLGCDQEQRIDVIEAKLDRFLSTISSGVLSNPAPLLEPEDGDSRASIGLPDQDQASLYVSNPQRAQVPRGNSLVSHNCPDSTSSDAGYVYQTWCHNQPLHLFRQEDFVDTLRHRDAELQLAIQIHGGRFPPGTLTEEKQQAFHAMTQACRKLINERIASGKVKLSTMQTLCILSVVGFAEGNPMQAGLDLSMAYYFMTSLPLGLFIGNAVESRLCAQSISLLQCLQEFVSDGSKSSKLASLPRQPNYLLEPPLSSKYDRDPDVGVQLYANQAARTWQMARAYAASHVGPDEPPPWHPQSDYSIIMLRNLEVDSSFPIRYRFASSNFGQLSAEALQKHRDYWSLWIFVQFVHCAVPALLNHPFLLSMRLRNFRQMMPQPFMHQSFDHISRNTSWVIHFLDLLEKQQFVVSNPVVAHCVAIVATIHLQHSFVKDHSLRGKAKAGFDKCMKFLDRMSTAWPYVFSMVENLRKLQESIRTMTPSSSGGSVYATDALWSVDAQLLWDILVYEKAGRPQAMADRSMFSDTLGLQTDFTEPELNDFATVGSAGISGHRTVRKDISAYAPEDDEACRDLQNDSQHLRRVSANGPSEMFPDNVFNGVGPGAQSMDQNVAFLQAEDFGRAINDWFNFDFNFEYT